MIVKVCAIALLGGTSAFILKCFGAKGAPLIAVATILTLFSLFDSYFTEIISIFDTVSGIEGVAEGSKTIVKVLGIGYLSSVSSDICREIGEGGIASVIVTVARLEALLVALPIFEDVLSFGLELTL